MCFNSSIHTLTVGLWKGRQVHKSSIVASYCMVKSDPKRNSPGNAARGDVRLYNRSSPVASLVFFHLRGIRQISDDLAHNLCPPGAWTWFNKCVYSRAAAVRWLTVQLSYHARLELWLVAGLRPAPQRREGTAHIWPSYSRNRKQFVESSTVVLLFIQLYLRPHLKRTRFPI